MRFLFRLRNSSRNYEAQLEEDGLIGVIEALADTFGIALADLFKDL